MPEQELTPEPEGPNYPLEPPIPMPTPTRVEKPKKARVHVQVLITHQVPDYEARRPETGRFTQELESMEDRYEIRLTATNEWAPISTGHIPLDKVVLLHLLNKTPTQGPPRFGPRGMITEPSKEWKVLIIGLVTSDGIEPFCSLAPGQDIPISPMQLDKFRIRAEEGECRYNLFAIEM